MTDTSKLREVFLREFEATGRNLDAALAAVVTTVKAQFELTVELPRRPDEVARRVVLRKYDRLAAQQVITEAAREWHVDPEHLGCVWARRSAPHVRARWTAWTVLHARPFNLSLPECAAALGMRNHVTVLRAIREMEQRPELLATVARVRQRLGVGIATVNGCTQQPATTAETDCNSQHACAIPAQPAAPVSTLASEEAA